MSCNSGTTSCWTLRLLFGDLGTPVRGCCVPYSAEYNITIIHKLVKRSKMQTRTTRKLTWQRVKNTLANAFVPQVGANIINKLGRGNIYSREDDNTVVKIYNLQAFADLGKKKAAAAHYLDGMKLEKAGNSDGAQEHYKLALNQMMSFSVLLENAPAFDNCFQITCQVVEVPTRADEDVLILGINQPRPVAITANFITDSVSFDDPAEEESKEATPSTTPAAGESKTNEGNTPRRSRRGATAK